MGMLTTARRFITAGAAAYAGHRAGAVAEEHLCDHNTSEVKRAIVHWGTAAVVYSVLVHTAENICSALDI